jgi:erythronate-4-phosphate dehydrogenase
VQILADPQIPLVTEAFAEFGEVRLLPGREWRARDAAGADLLLVRSVTPVNEALLAGSAVQFVGSATSGIDHIDLDYLRQRGIGFAHAPGANAQSVVEYVLSALCALLGERGRGFGDITVGIIGCGQIGSRLRRVLEALGARCLVNDPPLQENTGDIGFCPLADLASVDVLTMHAPLTQAGPYVTRGLIGADFLKRTRDDLIIINAARGGIVDEAALLHSLHMRPGMRAVIDCWEHEPQIDPALLAQAEIATPHIAGYSYDGKLRGTEMLYQAACRYFGRAATWQAEKKISIKTNSYKILPTGDLNFALRALVLDHYDVRRESLDLKSLSGEDPAQRAAVFDALRRNYPPRREFAAASVQVRDLGTIGESRLRALGFSLEPA